jgi:hypothetical protein
MATFSRNLLVIFNTDLSDEKAISSEHRILSRILIEACSTEQFCIAHELVDRNSITSRSRRIIKESSFRKLRPFRFLINKN